MEIALSVNGPGELWGWARPFIMRVKEKFPEATLSMFLFPCPYATGKEVEVAKTIPGLQQVFSPSESLQYIFLGKKPSGFVSSKPTLLHLGGDLMYASLLARRMRAPAYAYQWGSKLWDSFMRGYFVSRPRQKELLMQRGIPQDKIMVTGDLLVDAILLDLERTSEIESAHVKESLLVTFLPGSRPVEIAHLLPFYLRVAEYIKAMIPTADFAVSISPFVLDSEVGSIIGSDNTHVLESSHGVLVESDGEKFIQTYRGVRIAIHRGDQYSLMKRSDCVVTIPGTKSGEAGLLGIPMLILLPTNKLELIPYPGLANILEKIPGIGPLLKRFVLSKVLRRIKFLAQPNLLAEKMIVPELIGNLTAQMVADVLVKIFSNENKRQEISRNLIKLYQEVEPGASKIMDTLMEQVS